MTPSDRQLLESSIEDPSTFGGIFDRHFAAIYQFCARRVGSGRGEELAGETFRRAFEQRDRFDPATGDVRPWLFGITLNLVRDTLRRSGRQDAAYVRWWRYESSTVQGIASGAVAAVDAERDLALVLAALDLQPSDEVEVLLLHVWDDLSYAEIAIALAIPIGTVRSRLHRIHQRLREVLDPSLPFGPPSICLAGGSR